MRYAGSAQKEPKDTPVHWGPRRLASTQLHSPEPVLLFRVEQQGKGACATGHFSCFYRKLDELEQ